MCVTRRHQKASKYLSREYILKKHNFGKWRTEIGGFQTNVFKQKLTMEKRDREQIWIIQIGHILTGSIMA